MTFATTSAPLSPASAGVSIGRLRVSQRVARAIAAAPEAIVVGAVGVALAAGATVSVGAHRPWFTLPLAAVITALLWFAVARNDVARTAVDAAREAKGALAALGGTIAWTVIGLIFSSEYLIVSRDPGFLALSGLWLTSHPSTDIPTLGAVDAASLQSNMLPDAWQAWNLEGDVVQPQGAKMLPAVLAVGGWISGLSGVLGANVLIGGVGLLALYVLARRLLGPVAALVPPAVLGLTVAHVGLSRSPYSEPLTLILIVAGAAWAWRGLESRRLGALAAAGLVTGAASLVRIDGAAYAIGVLAGVAFAATTQGKWGGKAVVAFALPQALAVMAGYMSLARWSAAYIERLGDEASTLRFAYGAALAAALLVAAVAPAAALLRREPRPARVNRVARVAAAATVAALVILASRPLWMTAHRGTESTTDQFTNKVVAGFQASEGYTVDPTRTYAEHTVTWLSYYLTWPVIAAAIIGFGVLAWLAFARRPGVLVFLGMVAVPSAVYLISPEIVPDQLWAIRRFEPATLPGFALAAAVGARWVATRVAQRWPRTRFEATAWATGIVVLLPLTTYPSIRWSDEERPFSGAAYMVVREQQGARQILDELCELIDGRPTVLGGESGYFGSLRVSCDVPVVLALEAPTPQTLIEMTEVWGEAPVVVTRKPEFFWDEAPVPAVVVPFYTGEYSLQYMPREINEATVAWYVGVVEADGSVTPLPPLP